MSSHFADSGELPLEALGEPEQYAAALLAGEQAGDDAG